MEFFTLNKAGIKEILKNADIEFHKRPSTDDGFSDWLDFMTNKVCETLSKQSRKDLDMVGDIIEDYQSRFLNSDIEKDLKHFLNEHLNLINKEIYTKWAARKRKEYQ